MHRFLLFAALFTALSLSGWNAHADWLGLSRYGQVAEVAIEADAIRLNLRIAAATLQPPALSADHSPLPAWLAERLPQFLGADGQPLPPQFESVRNADGAYEANLRYPLKSSTTLNIAPPAALPPMGMVVLHRGVPLADLLALDKPLALHLDWADPWRSHFADASLIRRHAEPHSYLYVEPYEVRHEMLLRLADLRGRVDFKLRNPAQVDDSEREALKKQIAALVLQHNPLRIDGVEAVPQLDRVEFVRFNRGGIVPITEGGHLDARTLLVGVSLAYLTDQPAHTLQLDWEWLAAAAARPVSVIQGKDNFDGYLTAAHPRFEWSADEAFDAPPAPAVAADDAADSPPPAFAAEDDAPLLLGFVVLAALLAVVAMLLLTPYWLQREPLSIIVGLTLIMVVGLLLRPAPTLQANAAAQSAPPTHALLQALLHNAYRAFQLRDESKAYDRLAKSLDGVLLDDIYLQQRRALLRQTEGLGGEGKVDRIEVLDSQVLEDSVPGQLRVAARWMAHGTVSHWGHAHERHNLYQAQLSLHRGDDGQWKIMRLDFQGGKRLTAETAG